MKRMRSYGRIGSKRDLLAAKSEFESRPKNSNGSVASTELAVFSSRLDQPTRSSANDVRHETHREALDNFRPYGRGGSKAELSAAKAAFEKRKGDAAEPEARRGGPCAGCALRLPSSERGSVRPVWASF